MFLPAPVARFFEPTSGHVLVPISDITQVTGWKNIQPRRCVVAVTAFVAKIMQGKGCAASLCGNHQRNDRFPRQSGHGSGHSRPGYSSTTVWPRREHWGTGAASGESFAEWVEADNVMATGDKGGATAEDLQPARPSADSATLAATKGVGRASSDRSAVTVEHFLSRLSSCTNNLNHHHVLQLADLAGGAGRTAAASWSAQVFAPGLLSSQAATPLQQQQQQQQQQRATVDMGFLDDTTPAGLIVEGAHLEV
jgi:hypothetical protein